MKRHLTSSAGRVLCSALFVLVIAGCGRSETELYGTWRLDLRRTVEGTKLQGKAAIEKLESLLSKFEVEFTPDKVRLRTAAGESEGSWTIKSRSGDQWVLKGKGGDLRVQWLDSNTILFRMAKDSTRPMQGLILVRQ